MRLRGLLVAGVVVFAVAAALYHTSEAHRLHARVDALVDRCQLLESQLAEALRLRAGATQAVADVVERLRAQRQVDAAHRDPIGMPDGVRLALLALNDCLRDDDHGGLRFFFARAIEDRVLRDVELVDRDAASLRTRVWLAGEVEVVLQRDLGQITIRLRDGEVVSGGERRLLPAEGESIVLAEVDGPLWERRCSLCLRTSGEYPPHPTPAVERRRHRLEAVVAADWLQRFDRLLSHAGTELDLHVGHVGGLHDGAFLDVLLLGYDAGRKLALAAEAGRLTVELGPDDSVELMLHDGVLRRAGGDTTIPERGYGILLPSVRAEDAVNQMLGMVVHR